MVVFLFIAPLLQFLLPRLGWHFLTFERGWRPFLAHYAAAPFIALAVLLAWRRARFALYIFLTLEVVRAFVNSGNPVQTIAYVVLVIACLFTPSARRYLPTVWQSKKMRQR